jgi:hypothetical protein
LYIKIINLTKKEQQKNDLFSFGFLGAFHFEKNKNNLKKKKKIRKRN